MPKRKNRKVGKIREVGRIENSKHKAEQSKGHVIERFFACY